MHTVVHGPVLKGHGILGPIWVGSEPKAITRLRRSSAHLVGHALMLGHIAQTRNSSWSVGRNGSSTMNELMKGSRCVAGEVRPTRQSYLYSTTRTAPNNWPYCRVQASFIRRALKARVPCCRLRRVAVSIGRPAGLVIPTQRLYNNMGGAVCSSSSRPGVSRRDEKMCLFHGEVDVGGGNVQGARNPGPDVSPRKRRTSPPHPHAARLGTGGKARPGFSLSESRAPLPLTLSFPENGTCPSCGRCY